MKISEETLSDIASRGLLTKGEKEQILENQKTVSELKDYLVFTDKEWVLDGIRKLKEDAEKWIEYQKDEGKEWDSKRVFELIRMEERLKKRIEELNEYLEEDFRKGINNSEDGLVLDELQKILGEKK